MWHIPSLSQDLKHRFFVPSLDLHKTTKRATPEMFSNYKTTLLLYKTSNDKISEDEWLHFNMNAINTTKQTGF
jgi:hypothetical protein